MITVDNQTHSSSSFDRADVYDPDDVGGRSPGLQPIEPNLQPSPSPPPEISVPDVDLDKAPKQRHRASMGDGVLVHFMANGKYQELSRQVAKEPLAAPDEAEDDSEEAGVNVTMDQERDDATEREGSVSEAEEDPGEPSEGVDVNRTARTEQETETLAALAMKALRRTEKTPPKTDEDSVEVSNGSLEQPENTVEPMEDVKPSLPSIIVNPTDARPILDAPAKTDLQGPPSGALPPIQKLPSISSGGNTVTLPSLSDQLGDIKNLPETPRDKTTFSQSPPAPPHPLFNAVSPKSPIDFRALPSPAGGFFYPPHRRLSKVDQSPYQASVDYSSSNAETPSDHTSPALNLDRMSIEGLTNPQIGGFQCTYTGCTAAPFQTQYLLNSHANVHSQNRPHYCSVKGCPRSEGGKGFKRKNEMIRHGLVHDSPGYVCPFCPDREHKYPRPDNLQRHVRVHHIDKDKEDPLLRDVLAQRPEGPSRGRRRRGATG